VKEEVVDSINAFHAAIRKQWDIHPVYRGEPLATYQLRPKIGRLRVINPKWNTVNRERNMLRDFRKRAIPFLVQRPSNSWEWLAVAQHHGLPTRLLDWTSNALVAAYFAVRSRPQKEDAAIYVINRVELPQADETIEPFDIKTDFIYEPPHSSTRFIAQSGVFTAHSEPEKKFAFPSLQKWTLKKECCLELLGMLHCYGISPATMFPDLSGLCEQLTDDWTVSVTDFPREKKEPASLPDSSGPKH
jgi:hypothetical protein